MTNITEGLAIDGTAVVRIENAFLQVDVAPGVGGRIVNCLEKGTGHQFLWHNKSLLLERLPSGSEYDPNFYGGIDDLIPNDIPESIDGVAYADHGELWTTPMLHGVKGDLLHLEGILPLSQLYYTKRVGLRPDSPHLDLDYRVENRSAATRHFMWKLHAALNVEPGDTVVCPARTARVSDLRWSRWHTLDPFTWPVIEGNWVDQIPPADGTCDFFYLYDLEAGQISWESTARGLRFGFEFDTAVFPFAWLFASYGGLLGYYTVVLEPCSGMPLSVNEAAKLRQCSRLEPGECIETRVTIYAGPTKRNAVR
jgi:hypothetical protein